MKTNLHINEAGDHEVGMAQGQLEALIKAAQELQTKLGATEKDVPGWIQGHITSAYEYLKQANDNFHELAESNKSKGKVKLFEEFMNEAKANKIDQLVDVLSNLEDAFDEDEFVEWGSEDLKIPETTMRDVWNGYWDLGAKDRLHFDSSDWAKWLKKEYNID